MCVCVCVRERESSVYSELNPSASVCEEEAAVISSIKTQQKQNVIDPRG